MSSDPKLAMQQAAELANRKAEQDSISEQKEIRMAKEHARQAELAAARAKARGATGENVEEPTTKRRKKNRWGTVEDRKDNVVAIIPAEMKPELQEAYMHDIEVKNISKMLKAPDLGIPSDPRDRSPSPPPTYSYVHKCTLVHSPTLPQSCRACSVVASVVDLARVGVFL